MPEPLAFVGGKLFRGGIDEGTMRIGYFPASCVRVRNIQGTVLSSVPYETPPHHEYRTVARVIF